MIKFLIALSLFMSGGLCGITLMCLLQINREEEDE